MSRMTRSVLVLGAIASLAAGGAGAAQARHGADDPAGHNRGDEHGGLPSAWRTPRNRTAATPMASATSAATTRAALAPRAMVPTTAAPSGATTTSVTTAARRTARRRRATAPMIPPR